MARQAVYSGETSFWGLVSLDCDISPAFAEAALDPPSAGLALVLQDRTGHLLAGEKTVLEGNPVVGKVDLPDGAWKLSAIPAGGWDAAVEQPLLEFRGITLAIVLLLDCPGLPPDQLPRETETDRPGADRRTPAVAHEPSGGGGIPEPDAGQSAAGDGGNARSAGARGGNEGSLCDRPSAARRGPGADDRHGDGASGRDDRRNPHGRGRPRYRETPPAVGDPQQTGAAHRGGVRPGQEASAGGVRYPQGHRLPLADCADRVAAP